MSHFLIMELIRCIRTMLWVPGLKPLCYQSLKFPRVLPPTLNPLTAVPALPTLQKDTTVADCLFASLGPLEVVVRVVEPPASSGGNSPENDKHNSSSSRSKADTILMAFVPGMMHSGRGGHVGRDRGSKCVTG